MQYGIFIHLSRLVMQDVTNRQILDIPADSETIDTKIGGFQEAFYAKGNIVPTPLIERAEGIYMWDSEDNEYIDASSGPMVSGIGHGNARVAEAMADQARRMEYAYTRVARNRPNWDYAERLAGLAGPGFERVGLASGGSEAVDNALKFVRQYAVATGQPAKRHIISCQPSYHGATISTLAVSGDDAFTVFLEGFAQTSAKIPAPFSYRLPADHSRESYATACADALEAKILELGAENTLAFIFEPVGGLSTGCVVPPARYFRRVRDICDAHGVFLIFDEVLCGAGRTGKFLAAHHWPDALPDIVVKAKGLGAGYAPLGAMLAPARLVDELAGLTGCEFSYSYNAHPVSCAAGLAVLDEYVGSNLVQAAEVQGRAVRAGLKALQQRYPVIGDIRGLGLLLAVELVADPLTKAPLPAELKPTEKIRIHGLNNGVMLYSRATSGCKYGHWFIVSPPLNITDDECAEMLRRIDRTLADFCGEMEI